MDASIQALFSLDERTAVVTGASRGIGAAIARALAGAGAAVLATGRSSGPDAAMPGVAYTSCDARDAGAMAAAIDGFLAGRGLDVYVHAAGITLPVAQGAQDAQVFEGTLAANLTAAFHGCGLAAERMKPRQRGSIITVTSIGAVLGFPGNPGYVASKGGLRMMTKALARDLAGFGIRVNSIAPGYIRTAMTEAGYLDPARHAARVERMMLPRWGQPDDLAGAAVFLASDASSYVTGIDLFVDGGWTAKGL